MPILNDADKKLLPMALRAKGGFHLASRWYLGFDPLWYQYSFHQSNVPNQTLIAGIASGKTTGVAASYFVDCISIPYFRALNTSVTAKQAELPFEMISTWIEDNKRVEHLIDNVSLRPYPTISFASGAEWVFRTMGKDARFIRGEEYDRINVDEAGLDYSGEAIKVLRGRLRGQRPDGTKRMARMDVITSPTDAPWLRERFDKGVKGHSTADLKHYFSMRITTYMNTRLDPEQIRLMEAEYSDEMIDIELNGIFPDYGMSMFPKSHIDAITDQSILDAVYEALNPESGKPKKGYVIEDHPRYGTLKLELPYVPGHTYIAAGDPGQDAPPKRNAPCVMVADVTQKPYTVVYFDWISGKGSYSPFLQSYKYCLEKYNPVLKGMDTTGTQKAIDELAFENVGISIDGINFQSNKDAMLNSLSMAITNHDFRIPMIKGLIRQLKGYQRDDDKIPQDIVMTMCQLAYLARSAPDEEGNETGGGSLARSNRRFRTHRARRR